ncbi:hypothetical protein EDC19_2222 [Natranaerovirga hydrolytica]|uniref:Uncharacterized protein n=1 Tax=Natranaerovirga hydrolytica TaxID=680378 RepID=A0A4R1MJ58_9FIRM|nr:hypothetical protein [Natranaerovirga hydrolytica]TCK92487.1 hypothetical protein EDC19_2222 [Natranaerovirga hydrolytica]
MKLKQLSIKKILFLTVILTVSYIVLADVDNSASKGSGAGEIWWTEVEEIHQSYDKLSGE